ncbi:MAG: selenocysteine-specific translation elongation factor [Actinomycetota bacterium]|nr:selenocysteine-specific translation elongation factor [Actinomycetota bacterium]
MHVVATAGHVDHGKSTLVAALTGTDPDRWAEEKTRGLTIDLGFAHATLPSGREVSFVDVPGHVRFVRNMLAGVGAVDACLLIVAATEGWKPQSEEHLRILDLLGVDAGLVVVTKTAPAGAVRTASVIADVRERLAPTLLHAAPLLAVDSLTGDGLDALVAALDDLVEVTPTAADRNRPRLWVDRCFPIRGAGTVVTGTLAGGSFRVGDPVVATGPIAGVPGPRLRIRGIHVHDQPRDRAGPGNRVALNTTGADHHSLGRGDAVITAGQWHACRRFDASLRVLDGLDHPVSRRGAWAIHIGTGEHAARLRILGPDAIEPGAQGLVRVHLPVALPLLPGDRFVLREHGRAETVGGGEILDVDPVLPAARARPDRSAERVVRERGWVEADLLARLTGTVRVPDVAGRWVVDPLVLAAQLDELTAAVAAAGPLGLDVASLDTRRRALLENVAGIRVEAGFATVGGAAPVPADEPWMAALVAQPWSPPDPYALGADRAAVRAAIRHGQVVDAGGVLFAASAVDAAARLVGGLLEGRPTGVTVAEVRDALGSSRRFVLALLSHLDATGVTRRRGDVRIGGPRLPVS